MKSQRNTAIIIFLVISVMIFFTWSDDKKMSLQNQYLSLKNDISKTKVTEATDLLNIETDIYVIKVNLDGGDIVYLDLKDQKEKIHSNENFHLLKITNDFKYLATADLKINGNILKPKYIVNKKNFKMDSNSVLIVPITYEAPNGSIITKKFEFTPNQHSIKVSFNIDKLSSDSNISIISSLQQSKDNPSEKSGMFGTSAYRGVAYSTLDTRYSKESFEYISELSVPKNIVSNESGWVSMIQHYFVSAIINIQPNKSTIFMTSADENKTAIVGIENSGKNYKTGEIVNNISTLFWIGAKNQDEMKSIANHLELTVDYGWLAFISEFLLTALKTIHKLLNYVNINNWGVAIIILTLLVRGIMYPLTKKQYTSMAKMRMLTPKMNIIKEKYKDDRQKLGQEMMMLYQKEGVNPLGGCFPILIQMPIFIALYWTLMESTELRHSPFILWIDDLSAYDNFFVLPILMGITMFIIQKMSPTPVTDPLQKKIFLLMPVVFTFMFCTFPAGLTLYWLVSNIVTIVQQYLIFKHLEKVGLHVKVSN
ncbi:MAG: membrane protein insertase YidC [Succinivibrionaceae bacterium]